MLCSRVKVTVPAWPNLSLLQPEKPSPEMEALLSQPPPPLLLLGESASQEIHLHGEEKSEIVHQTISRERAFACEAVFGYGESGKPTSFIEGDNYSLAREEKDDATCILAEL